MSNNDKDVHIKCGRASYNDFLDIKNEQDLKNNKNTLEAMIRYFKTNKVSVYDKVTFSFDKVVEIINDNANKGINRVVSILKKMESDTLIPAHVKAKQIKNMCEFLTENTIEKQEEKPEEIPIQNTPVSEHKEIKPIEKLKYKSEILEAENKVKHAARIFQGMLDNGMKVGSNSLTVKLTIDEISIMEKFIKQADVHND